MARRDRAQADVPQRTLSVTETLAALAVIERSLDAFERSAPHAVAAMGGRDALQARSQMTCIGPMPRLTVEEWELLAAEHADGQRGSHYQRAAAR